MNEHLTREGFWRLMHGIDVDGNPRKEPSGGEPMQELRSYFAPEVAADQLMGRAYPSQPRAPLHFWWAIPGRLVVVEQSARDRLAVHKQELGWLRMENVRWVVCTIGSDRMVKEYGPAGLESTHIPVTPWTAKQARLTLGLSLLGNAEERLSGAGAVAIHGDRQSTFAAALAAAFLYQSHGWDLDDALAEPSRHGMPLDVAGRLLVTESDA